MSKVAITGNASGTGTLTIAAPNTDNDRTITLPDDTGEIVTTSASQTLTNKIVQGGTLTSATAVTASGTAVDFTSIPSWVKRITVMFSGVSTSGTSLPQIQIGDSGGVETTGYVSLISSYGAGTASNSTTGILANALGNASYVLTGIVTIAHIGSNLWVASMITNVDPSLGNFSSVGSARKTLSDTLTQVRITTVNGTDTFDAGTINIMYEG